MTELSSETRTRVLDALRQQRVETASWAYANSGTRFKVFPQPGVPRTPEEKIDDAATVHGTQKPVEAMRRPVVNNSGRGEAVYATPASGGSRSAPSMPTSSRTTTTGSAA